MRRSDPYSDTNWDENGVLNSNSLELDEFRVNDGQGLNTFQTKKSSMNSLLTWFKGPWRRRAENENVDLIAKEAREKPRSSLINVNRMLVIMIMGTSAGTGITRLNSTDSNAFGTFTQMFSGGQEERPAFVYEHPYISCSYYTSTKSISTLKKVDKVQVQPKKEQLAGKKAEGEKDYTRETKTHLAILRPFCAFDAGPLPTTFDCWQNFPPCRASAYELGDELDPSWYDEDRYFDDVGSHMQRDAKAGEFNLFMKHLC